MELEKLKIDRKAAAPRRRGARGPWFGRVVVLLVLLGVGFLLRVPLLRLYDRIALPAVSVGRAVKTSPIEATAVSGTAANGYLIAARRAALSADTPGRIVEMNVTEGSVVKRGFVVARLYAKEYEAAVAQADAELVAARAGVERAGAELDEAKKSLDTLRANVASAAARVKDAQAQVDLAQLQYDRAQNLFDSGSETQTLLDEAETTLTRARAGLASEEAAVRFARAAVARGESRVVVAGKQIGEAEARVAVQAAALAQARATLDKTEVRAPFDGIVVLKDAEVGEVVSPNSQGGNSRGSVVTMVDFDSLEVQVDLPETALRAVAEGDPANIYLDAYPEVLYRGAVTRIWPTANRQKGTVELRVKFAEPDARLRPEMGARVVFKAEAAPADAPAEAVVFAPANAVVREGGGASVFVVERGRLERRAVELGATKGGRVVVTKGLAGGESLVLAPANDLEDGMRVRIEDDA